MKTLIQTALLTTLLASTATMSMANSAVNQDAISVQTVTVQQAKQLPDDRHVKIKGYVVKALGDENYQFRDATGSIQVEIDDELWNGKGVSAKTPVTIIGEVDVDRRPHKHVEIDVDRVIF